MQRAYSYKPQLGTVWYEIVCTFQFNCVTYKHLSIFSAIVLYHIEYTVVEVYTWVIFSVLCRLHEEMTGDRSDQQRQKINKTKKEGTFNN